MRFNILRSWWLLALPWAVVIDSIPFNGPDGHHSETTAVLTYKGEEWAFMVDGNKPDSLKDLAAALNYSHERLREEKVIKDNKLPPCGDHDPSYFGTTGCYVSPDGCTPADSCGKEPQ